MDANEERLKRLSQRAERSFHLSSPSEVVGSRKAIIGPRSDLLTRDAEAARDMLLRGANPTARQLAALEQAIRLQRPAPPCRQDELTSLPEEGNWLAEQWTHFQPILKRLQGSVARLERVDDPEPTLGTGRTTFGTGFLVASDMLMTAAHVVDELSFATGVLDRGQAIADFHGYYGVGGAEVHDIVEVVAVDLALDLALLRIDSIKVDDEHRPTILPNSVQPAVGLPICVVGFPLEDPRNPIAFSSILFGNRFGVKRAAVGEITSSKSKVLFHDCSTLGGNSGSPVFDLASGEVCGVHVSGRAMIRNEAICGARVHEFVTRSLALGSSLSPLRRSTLVKTSKPSFDKYYLALQESDAAITAEMESAVHAMANVESTTGRSNLHTLETIVLTKGRPVLDVKQGATVVDITEVESQIWKQRLTDANPLLTPNIPAVGRIEVANHPRGVEWLGTGWLLRDNIVVTNRHVAEIFSEASGAEFVFRPGFDETSMRATIDFLEEFDSDGRQEFPLFKIIHIERGGGPDMAFLRVEPVDGQSLPQPVTVSSTSAQPGEQVAVIGYPARDPFFPDPDLMDRIFNHRYDKKRLAPGLITETSSERVFHDCSTLGGNSGGEIVSLKTGHALALHFAGTLFTKNHAVPIDVVASRLDDVLKGRHMPEPRKLSDDSDEGVIPQSAPAVTASPRVVEATIPIKVRVEIGDVVGVAPSSVRIATSTRRDVAVDVPDDDLIETAEARPEDYRTREGYDPQFLGSDSEVPLPTLTKDRDDIRTFTFDGSEREVLDYEHFSVQMSISRRMCRFSACNIDGKNSKKKARTGWRTDPRIPANAQILKECYGNAPKFSRGHMTRREDPVWGSDSAASLGNSDSMHVTNTVPQIQIFNAGVWLDLEDYALDNARKDDMRICVFTGPFLANNDPIRFGVKIPISFWKVIAFIHDETDELCATGYTMSQKSFIGEEEFVFGRHENTQRPIAEIEKRAGISFGYLADLDPLKNLDESTPTRLMHPNQIRFLR